MSVEASEPETHDLIRANRRLLLLNQIANNFLLGENSQEQLNAAFAAVAGELGVQYYLNYRTDAAYPDILFLESSHGPQPDQRQSGGQIKFGEHLCGQVAQTRRPLIVENIHLLSDDTTARARAMGIKAYAGLPLVAHGHLFGTIALGSTRQNHFAASDIAFLQTLADQSAAMMDHARLLRNLSDSEANLTDFFDNATLGLHWVGPDGIILRANKAELALLGYSHDEYVGHHIAEFHASEEAIDDILARLSRDEKLHDYEARLRCKDGSLKNVEINSSGFWKDGKFVHSRCFTRDITERKHAEVHANLLMSEVNHRSKNLLSVVQAVARQTARTGDPATFVARLSERIDALSTLQDLLVKNQWKGVEVAELVAVQLAHLQDLNGSRVLINGPPARLTPAAAQGVGMALHELATNAGKYGALSNSDGRVHISWQVSAANTPAFLMSWLEQGGPKVAAPSHVGFGHIVLGRMAELAVGGTAAIDYRENGLSWTLSAPVESTLEPVGAIRSPRAY